MSSNLMLDIGPLPIKNEWNSMTIIAWQHGMRPGGTDPYSDTNAALLNVMMNGAEKTSMAATLPGLEAPLAWAAGKFASKKVLQASGQEGASLLRFGPHAEQALPLQVANSFRGGSYARIILKKETTLYRVFGGSAGEIGSYWTRTPPQGVLQAQMDLALNPAWGNTARNVVTIRVPAGTAIYEGAAAPSGHLLGGSSQVYIPRVDAGWVSSVSFIK